MANLDVINTRALNSANNNTGVVNLGLKIDIIAKSSRGFVGIKLKFIRYAYSAIRLPLHIAIKPNSGHVHLKLNIKAINVSRVTQNLAIYRYDTKLLTENNYNWRLKVRLDNIDVSNNLTGVLRIESQEGAAKIADFELMPFAGKIVVTKWIGKMVAIDYILQSKGRVLSEFILFRGIVDEPVYDPSTKLTSFSCSDRLQQVVAGLDKKQIDSLIGGHHSDVVFQDSDNYSYAKNRLSTIACSLDLDRLNELQLTPWKAKDIADFSFDENNILYKQITVTLANTRAIKSIAHVDIQYRYQILKQREVLYEYIYPLTICQQLNYNATMPNTDMIEQAISSTNWLVKNAPRYVHQRGPGWINCNGRLSGFLIRPQLQKYLVRDARFILAKRFAQSITENYKLKLIAPQSIDNTFIAKDNYVFEVAADVERFTRIEKYESVIDGVVDASGDITLEQQDKAKLDNAITTALNKAKTQILQAHRQNKVSFKVPINPLISCTNTVSLNTDNVVAKGKIVHIVHECNIASGSCVTSITLGVSKTDNDKVVNDSVLQAPQIASSSNKNITTNNRIRLKTHFGGPLDAPEYDESLTGYSGNTLALFRPGASLYPQRFVITTPAIDTTPRNINAEKTYKISIPDELLLLEA